MAAVDVGASGPRHDKDDDLADLPSHTSAFRYRYAVLTAFLDHDMSDVVATWESWVHAGQFVRAHRLGQPKPDETACH